MTGTAAPTPGERQIAFALIFVAPALWSVNYLVARWAPGVVAPHMLALARWGVAALMLGAFCWRELHAKRQPSAVNIGLIYEIGRAHV